jgi:hypothetical protein
MRNLLAACSPILLLMAAGCGSEPERSAPLGEAYTGPATLALRTDIPTRSPVAAVVKHGDRVEIVQRRRVFFKVRTRRGIEGWTHQRNLLTASEMEELRRMAEQAGKLPAQGVATTYDLLNVHTKPERPSPSFLQLGEGDKVEVLAHYVAPRSARAERPPLIPPAPERPKVVRKKRRAPKDSPLPLPAAPSPPEDWLELSKTAGAEEEEEEEEPQPPVPRDDWSLIRTSSGQVGWVLTGRLVLAIPDEVAQYAEGRRIMSYFSLGEVRDGDQVKHNWLWTTVNERLQPWDFDSFRVFIWSVRRHRYETAYIERNRKGYFPVLLHEVQLSGTSYPGFSVCVEKPDGARYRRSYAFIVNVVRFAGEQPCESTTADLLAKVLDPPAEPAPAAEEPKPGLLERVRNTARNWLGR